MCYSDWTAPYFVDMNMSLIQGLNLSHCGCLQSQLWNLGLVSCVLRRDVFKMSTACVFLSRLCKYKDVYSSGQAIMMPFMFQWTPNNHAESVWKDTLTPQGSCGVVCVAWTWAQQSAVTNKTCGLMATPGCWHLVDGAYSCLESQTAALTSAHVFLMG